MLLRLVLVGAALALQLGFASRSHGADGAAPAASWYEEITAFNFPHVFSPELTKENLKEELGKYTSEFALVEFYMPWCPHCQHFAPEMERIGLAISQYGLPAASFHLAPGTEFHKPPLKKDPLLVTGTVDCMRSSSLCAAAGDESSGFPKLMWGRREDWIAGRMSKIHEINIEDGTAEALASWINSKLKAHLDPSKTTRQQIMPLMYLKDGKPMLPATGLVVAPKHVGTWDVQLAVALFLRGAVSRNTFAPSGKYPAWMTSDQGRKSALMNFIDVLSRRYPEESSAKDAPCKASLQALHHRMKTDFNSMGEFQTDRSGTKFFKLSPDKLEKEWKLCGTDWAEYKRGWNNCRGTWPGKRGFTCGLWSTFHSVVARTDDEFATRDTEALRQAVLKFFDCDDCRDHFASIAIKREDTKTKAAAQIWWWLAHNDVNMRVGGIEQRYQDGDPSFPKAQWPTKEMCPDCWMHVKSGSFLSSQRSLARSGSVSNLSRGWDTSEATQAIFGEAAEGGWVWKTNDVLAFLDKFYG